MNDPIVATPFTPSPDEDEREEIALLLFDNPAAKTECRPIDEEDFGSSILIEQGDQLKRAMRLLHGVGLAAPQVGLFKRLFVWQEDDGKATAIANPVLFFPALVEYRNDYEACLSVPGTKARVERAASVTLEGRELTGEPVSFRLRAMQARIVQHEVDHLDGTFFLDRAGPVARTLARAQIDKIKRRGLWRPLRVFV